MRTLACFVAAATAFHFGGCCLVLAVESANSWQHRFLDAFKACEFFYLAMHMLYLIDDDVETSLYGTVSVAFLFYAAMGILNWIAVPDPSRWAFHPGITVLAVGVSMGTFLQWRSQRVYSLHAAAMT